MIPIAKIGHLQKNFLLLKKGGGGDCVYVCLKLNMIKEKKQTYVSFSFHLECDFVNENKDCLQIEGFHNFIDFLF